MYCSNCGNQLTPGAKFCGKCGSLVNDNSVYPNNPTEGMYPQPTAVQKKSKKPFLLLIPVVIVLAVIAIFISIEKSSDRNVKEDTRDFTDYQTVLEVVCDAINKRDKSILDDVVYELLGTEHNTEYIYNTVDKYYEDQEEWDESYGTLTTEIEHYEHYIITDDENEFRDFEEYILNQTGKIIQVEEAYELEMKNESGLEILLLKVNSNIHSRWYVIYLDL